jgi:murein DD-endopeptidase MepM/ murein hydrolase activator NlpD
VKYSIKREKFGNHLHTKQFGGIKIMKNEKENEKKTRAWKMKMKERKFYLYTAVGCAAALLSLVIVAVAATARGERPSLDIGQSGVEDSAGNVNGGTEDFDEPVGNQPEEMILPMQNVAGSGGYGFWYNKTLNTYHAHCGLDFAAETGAEVSAVMSGIVESIYRDDILSGTEIVVDHGDGLKSVYRFVTVAENLKVGDEVAQGDVIATVAAATGDEYKDGAHLHFEVLKNDKNVDPVSYLSLEEK